MSQGEPGVLRVVGPQAPVGPKGPRVLGNEGAEGRTLDPVADDGVSIGEGLPSPGRYIREQRQRRGMSVEQLAAATKIPRSSVVLLEEDRFDELPGPVFVKGFLRCSARALGVDADAVMELLYERERAQLNNRRRDRPAARTTGAANTRAPVARATGPASTKPSSSAARPAGSRATRAGSRPAANGARAPGAVAARAGASDALPGGAAEMLEPPASAQPGEGTTALATTEGSMPRLPPRIRRQQQAPARSPSVLRSLLMRIPSVSVLLWIVIAVLVAMVVMAAFNLVGQATTAAGA